MNSQTFNCRICCRLSDDTPIRTALQKALPSWQWEEGDSAWDKIRVWGTKGQSTIAIYRYEHPGPFKLTITLEQQRASEVEQDYHQLRDTVLRALDGSLWRPLEPQPVTLIKLESGFPSAYEFECDRDLEEIERTLNDAEFWLWQIIRQPSLPQERCLASSIPLPRTRERVRIFGEKPRYSLEVDHWEGVPDRDQILVKVQNTLLPGIKAYNVRARTK